MISMDLVFVFEEKLMYCFVGVFWLFGDLFFEIGYVEFVVINGDCEVEEFGVRRW